MISNIRFCVIVFGVFLVASVLSIRDPPDGVKTKKFHRDPQISEALYQHHQQGYLFGGQTNGVEKEKFDNFRDENPSVFVTEKTKAQYYSECPAGENGLFPYMYDCRSFLNCFRGRTVIQQCGPGTVFNPDNLECDRPDKVNCAGIGFGSGSRTARYQEENTNELKCNPNQGSLQPHPTDCRKFLNCANGMMFIQDCGPGTAFSPSMKVCDFEHKVQCGSQTNRGPKTFPNSGRTNTLDSDQDNKSGYRDRWTQMNMQRPPAQPHQTTATSVNTYRPQPTRQPSRQDFDYSSNQGRYSSSNQYRPTQTSYDEGQRKEDSDFSPSQYHPTSTNYGGQRKVEADNQYRPTNYGGQRKVDLDYPSNQYTPTPSSYDEGQRKVDTSFSSTAYNHRQNKANNDWSNTYGTERTYTNIDKPNPVTPNHHVVEGTVDYTPGRTYTDYNQPRTTVTHHVTSGSASYQPTQSKPESNVFYAQPVGNDEDSSEFFNSQPNKPSNTRTTTILVTKPPQHYPSSFDSRFGVVESSSTTPQMTVSVPSVIILPPLPSDIPTQQGNSSHNVKVFQIYPPTQNTSFQLYPDPHMSKPYSSVSHSRDNGIKSQPEIIYSRDGAVDTQQRTNLGRGQRTFPATGDYKEEDYINKNPNAEGNSEETASQLPMSDALKLLLRPYFNRSGSVSDTDADNANSHIMSLLSPKDNVKQDSELIVTGEQHDLNQSSRPSHHHHGHSKDFHDRHPGLPNPFKGHSEEFQKNHNKDFHDRHPGLPNPFKSTTEFTRRESTTIPPVLPQNEPEDIETIDIRLGDSRFVGLPQARRADVCEFECGNGKCIKKHQVCDGINQCGNRYDESKCEALGYEIRLAGDNEGKHLGRVEVKIFGQWSLVCDDKFGLRDANVLCKELGFPLGAAEVRGNSYYPAPQEMKNAEGNVRYAMDEIDCKGNETSLKECDFKGWGIHDCGNEEVLGVACKVPVMKCPTGYWLCSTSEECIHTSFVCDNVPDCSDKSDESSIICDSVPEYRLANGGDRLQGRVEVKYRGVWGSVCDDDFGENEATVVCKSLGFNGPVKLMKNAFGSGSGPIWLDQVSCYGNESSIDKCIHWAWGENNCNHTEDISIKCSLGDPEEESATKFRHSKTYTTPIKDMSTEMTFSDNDFGENKNTYKKCGYFNPNLTNPFAHPEDKMQRVIKGSEAKRGSHPWQATIRVRGRDGKSSHWCGAVLVSKRHLLTAAHCLTGYQKWSYFIRMGDHYSNINESTEVDIFIEDWYIHEQFRNGSQMNNDLALIVLKSAVRFSDYIQPICLPEKGAKYTEGRVCRISGWGSNKSGLSTPSNTLRAAEVPLMSRETCNQPIVYNNSITDGMFCAGFLDEHTDACDGDSGGPLACTEGDSETLFGIISWGDHCGGINKPGVYVKVDQYVDWIYQKMELSMKQQ